MREVNKRRSLCSLLRCVVVAATVIVGVVSDAEPQDEGMCLLDDVTLDGGKGVGAVLVRHIKSIGRKRGNGGEGVRNVGENVISFRDSPLGVCGECCCTWPPLLTDILKQTFFYDFFYFMTS